ncbi:MAG: ABC transporter ATP-binding protein [Acholeplasmataceae bacterium]
MEYVRTNDLKKVYRHGKLAVEVLKGITIGLNDGEFVSVVGPSGSGKTTLLYTISGLEPYTSGSVELFGRDLSSFSDKEQSSLRAKDIGFVFQFFNLIENLTVYENVLLASVLGTNETSATILRTLASVGMADYASYYPSELSGGMQQRVAIARALINGPRLLFADEPTGNLDYRNGLAIMELFRRLNVEEKKTILMVTHNEEMTAYGTRTLYMLDGKVIKDERTLR